MTDRHHFYRFVFIVFFDVPAIIDDLDYVVLPSFDFHTPSRNPEEADYFAPLHELNDRIKESNVDSQVMYWLGQHAPASKLIVGIPTYGRTWKLEKDSTNTGVPPIHGVRYFRIFTLLQWQTNVSKFYRYSYTNLVQKAFKQKLQDS